MFRNYKMNEVVNKFLLARDIFMPEMHLKEHGLTEKERKERKNSNI